LSRLRADRSKAEVDRRLSALRAAAKGKDNLMPFIYDAVKSTPRSVKSATPSAIVFGTYEEVAIHVTLSMLSVTSALKPLAP